jgi:ribose 5-phosphate isomerase B
MPESKWSVYIGSDHAGFDLKQELKKYISEKGYKTHDLGCFSNESVDYPDVAGEVCAKVVKEKHAMGILICGTGIGMMMAANKKAGIRAADCTHQLMAKMARLHNDANVLTLGSRIIGVDLAKHIVDSFLETKFEGEERHVRRIKKMMGMEDKDGKHGGLSKNDPDDCC